MDTFLTHTFSIRNHPISLFKETFRQQYVMGLGEFMCYMSKYDVRASLVFKVWANCILSPIPGTSWRRTPDFLQIRKATSLKRDGFRFFTMRRAFFFDCFYLVSKLDTKLVKKAYLLLHEHIKDVIARKVLQSTYDNWSSLTFSKNPLQLSLHRQKDRDFHKKSPKKILVVATMSAGKSTLINALMGYRINEVKTTACTSKLCYLYNKPHADGVIAKNEDGHYFYRYNVGSLEKGRADEIALHFNSILGSKRICLIDTPGTNYSGDKSHGEITRRAIASNNYDVIIFVVNSLQFNTDDEANLREYVLQHTQKPIVFVLNQLDCFNPDDDSVQETMNSLVKLTKRARGILEVVPLSAYYALILKIGSKNLTQQEQIQEKRLQKLFQYDYYDLSSYYKGNSNMPESKKEIDKTGITILEKILCKL